MAEQQQPIDDGFDRLGSFEDLDKASAEKEITTDLREAEEKVTPEGENLEKVSEPNGKEEAEAEEKEPSLFEDFQPPEGAEETPEDSEISTLAKELGFEDVTSREAFLEKFREYENGLKERVPTYPDESHEQYVKNFLEVAKNGGDPFKIRDTRAEIASIEETLKEENEWATYLGELQTKGSLDAKRQFLLQYLKNSRSEEEYNVLADYYGEHGTAEDARVLEEANRMIAAEAGQLKNKVTDKQKKIEELKASEQEAVRKSQEQREAFRAEVNKAIKSYQDPDGVGYFTKQAQKVAQQAFASDPVSLVLPKGVAKALFLNEEGAFDPNKAISTLASLTNAEAKRKHIESKVKRDEFKALQNFSGQPSKAAPGTSGAVETEEWGGGYQIK